MCIHLDSKTHNTSLLPLEDHSPQPTSTLTLYVCQRPHLHQHHLMSQTSIPNKSYAHEGTYSTVCFSFITRTSFAA